MSDVLHSRYTLRNAVPAVMLLAVLAILSFSYLESVYHGRAAVRQSSRSSAVLDAERLARITQRDLHEHPASVASDLSVASTEQRSAVLALVNPQGQILMAHRLAWRGQPAQKMIAHFSQERFLRVVQGRLPDVQEFDNPPAVAVMVPYFTEGRSGQIRNEDRGVVYLEYDLGHDFALVQWNAEQRMWPLLAAALLTSISLALLIRAKVTRPLARMERASRLLAQEGNPVEALEESGPGEIARLAHGFNTMAARIRDARRDSQNSQARLSAIFAAAMDAIITVDRHQHITVINAAALQMFRCSEEQVLGQSIDLLIPGRFRLAHMGHMQRFLETGESRRTMGHYAVVTGLRMDGEEFPAEASISHIRVDQELLLTVILRDVTERQRAQDAIVELNSTLEAQVAQRTAKLQETTLILEQQQQVLQAAHEEQRSIFNTVTVGIALVRNHSILRCNRKLEEVFGYGLGELDGKTTRLWYRDEQAFQNEGAPLFANLGPGQVQQHEQWLLRKDGSSFWARITGSRLSDTSMGNALLGVIEDMSMARAAEQAILQAKEQAVEASNAKSNFLANMSHEIRTPMNAIIGLSYLLLKSELNTRQREQVRKVQSSSQHLMSIINDILDYSKVEAGKLKVEHIEFDLDAVLDNVASLISEKAAAKGLELLFHVDRAVPQRLVGDPLRLGQIIVNYANNAVKFTAQGEVSIALTVREESDNAVLLHGAVRDTGIGLTAAQLPQLFQSFQQADSSTTREYGGTGLGLAICKQLATLMQGEVGVESEYGKGSTFWFTARLEKSHTKPRALALRSELYGKRVLVVDDNENARQVLRSMLATLNLEVHVEASGTEALQALRREDAQGAAFAMVFLDWQMPQMNGIEVAQQIAALDLRQPPAVVLVTGYGREEVLSSAQQVGIQTVLVKPVNVSTLFDCVLRELGTAQDQAALPAPRPSAAPSLRAIAGAHVLLVEDNELNREVAGELLADAGLLVDMAFDGQMALQQLQAQHYDLVLMDMQMPVLDGMAATRQLRALPQFADLPVIAMTANAMASDRQACLDAGMNDHVAKPIEPEALFATLLKWIRPLPGMEGAEVPSANATPEPALALPDIAGLDLRSGLRRVRGKRGFYRAMLRRFAQSQGNAVAQLRADLASGQHAEAQRRAHTLKGLAATMGMDAVAQAAAAVEAHCHAGADAALLQAQLQALDAQLAPLLQALAEQLAEPDPVPLAGVDAAALARVCTGLAALLADDNLEAVEWLGEHEALLGAGLAEYFTPLAAAVRRFDCAQALGLLRQATQALGIDMRVAHEGT